MKGIVFDPAARLNLVLWGDPQVTDLAHPRRIKNFTAACESVRDAEGRADALMVAGDVAEFGREADYRIAAAGLRIAAQNTDAILCASGNHDVRIRSYRRQLCRFRAFLCDVPRAAQTPYDRYYAAYAVNGFPFIVMGADRNSFESVWISRAQLAFVEGELRKAQAAGLPAFVLNHQPLNKTNGLPVTWGGRGSWRGGVGMQSDALRRILSSYGPVFYLTGHLHYCVSAYNVQNDGNLHMISAPSVGCENHGPNPAGGQGFVLSLYNDRLEGVAYDFVSARPMDESIPNARFTVML